ncbi:MAG: FAD:protein FMN transferase [Bacteroidales bacterium]|jgi:thiamine biosynthesis lipoprotein|nr:FAD:protein FMN transferase [Bacteroidales bacterium]
MNKNKILLLLLAIITISCQRNDITIRGFIQGSTYSITYNSSKNINYKNDIENLLAKFDTSLSTYLPVSTISKINSNNSNSTDFFFRTVFNKSQKIARETNGAFDITVAPIVNAWGFGFSEKENVDSLLIDSLLHYVGYNKLQIINKKLIKTNNNIMIDMNAIAQGYSVDVVADFLDKKNIDNYIVEIGGELKTKGVNYKKESWKVGLDKPLDNNNIPGENLQVIIKLNNKALATSGNYRKFYKKNGVKYSHTINPKTGYPVNHSLLSATVITKKCIDADGYATSFMVIGLEKSLDFLKKHPELDAYFVYSDTEGNLKVKFTKVLKNSLIKLD